jgi:hypothetical protein
MINSFAALPVDYYAQMNYSKLSQFSTQIPPFCWAVLLNEDKQSFSMKIPYAKARKW